MEQTFDERLSNISIAPEELEQKARESFEKTINALDREEFKILTRNKIENKNRLAGMEMLTGVAAALFVLAVGAGVFLPEPIGTAARIAVCLEIPGYLMVQFEPLLEIIINKLVSSRIRKDLKEAGIEYRWKGLDICLKQDDEYVKYDNSKNIEAVNRDLESEQRDREIQEMLESTRQL